MVEYIKPLEMFAVEVRVLGLRRAIRDHAYYRWCMFWLNFDPLWVMNHIPLVAGCRGYFDARDAIDFPVITRWCSLKWRRWRQKVAT